MVSASAQKFKCQFKEKRQNNPPCKDPNMTFFIYDLMDNTTIVDASFYEALKQKLPMQPIVFALINHDDNTFSAHEVQIYAKKSVKIAIWNRTNEEIKYFQPDLFLRRHNLTGVALTTCHETASLPYFSFINGNCCIETCETSQFAKLVILWPLRLTLARASNYCHIWCTMLPKSRF